MKNFTFILLLLAGMAHLGNAQRVEYRQPASERAIPGLVLNTFKEQYPKVLLQGWFITHIAYWQGDYSSGWYHDWYGNRTLVVYTFERPTYFEVEFINRPGELSRAIYNLHGYWYETRSQVKGMPIEVMESMNRSEYAGWRVSPMMERIENPSWPLDIYRFRVTKGMKGRIIRIDEKGNFIQAKYLQE